MATFDDLGLDEALLEAVRSRGFETPTPIQAEMIPHLLENEGDVVGLAQTGTGKTAAFGLPVLQKLVLQDKAAQALVLAPTRELCMQVAREISDYGRHLKGLIVAPIYGGTAFGPQIRSLRAGAQVVVATPGRLKDLLDKGVANLSSLRFLVLDEADQMLDMGFRDELDAILESASPDRNTLLFSATMPREVARIASQYMNNPHEIVSGEKNKGSSTVEHRFYRVYPGSKYAVLRRLIDMETRMYSIIFCRTRDASRDIAAKLAADGYAADALHGELSQAQRESVMRRFRQGNPSILVATDVAARGLDLDDLTHVIHYDLPDEIAVYNHRSGRTGRAGKSGASLALVHIREGYRIGRIERVLGCRIKESRIPGGEDICKKKLNDLTEAVLEVSVDEEALSSYMEQAESRLEGLDRDELLRRFVVMNFGRILEEYRDASELNPPPPPKRSRRDAKVLGGRGGCRGGYPSGGMVRLRVNVGRRQSVLPPQIIGLVNQATHSRTIRLGRIDIGTDWTDFQVEAVAASGVERSLQNFSFRGVQIRVERGRDNRPPKEFGRPRHGGKPRRHDRFGHGRSGGKGGGRR